MRVETHQFEDKLLEFAYGELPAHEAGAVEAHVHGCERCRQALADIRAVRTTMQRLPAAEAPAVGLESLLAYAEAQARRNAAAAPRPWWRRAPGGWWAPLASVAALSVVAVVAWRAQDEFHPAPAAVALKVAAPAVEAQPLAEAERTQAAAEPTQARLEDGARAQGATPKLSQVLAKRKDAPRPALADDSSSAAAVGSLDLRSVSREARAARGDSAVALLAEKAPAPAEAEADLVLAPAAPPPRAAAPAKEAKAANRLAAGAGLGALGGAAAADAKAEAKQDRPGALQLARLARRDGDRAAELRMAVLALEGGVTPAERMELLASGCSAAEALGDPVQTDRLCDQLLREFPASQAAQALSSRRKQVQLPAAAPAPARPSDRR